MSFAICIQLLWLSYLSSEVLFQYFIWWKPENYFRQLIKIFVNRFFQKTLRTQLTQPYSARPHPLLLPTRSTTIVTWPLMRCRDSRTVSSCTRGWWLRGLRCLLHTSQLCTVTGRVHWIERSYQVFLINVQDCICLWCSQSQVSVKNNLLHIW